MVDSTPFSSSPLPVPPLPPTATQSPVTSSSSLPIVRGRPRSTSISNGSPNPPPNPFLPLPSLFPDSAPSTSSTQNSFRPPQQQTTILSNGNSSSIGKVNGGWGHKPAASVPNLLSFGNNEFGSPTSYSNRSGGKHRRSQSVSPEGFPVLFDKSIGVSSSSSSSNASGINTIVEGSGSNGLKEWTYPKPSPIPISNHSSSSSSTTLTNGLSTSPHSPNFFSLVNNHSNSPNSNPNSPLNQHLFPHHQHQQNSSSSSSTGSPLSNSHHFPSSHSALLSGVRSHALPHSPNMDATSIGDSNQLLGDAFDHISNTTIIHHHPILSSSPSSPAVFSSSFSTISQSSPPFGPTSTSNHHIPSPLALELLRGSPSNGSNSHNRDDSPHPIAINGSRRRSFSSNQDYQLLQHSQQQEEICLPCLQDDIFPSGRLSPPLQSLLDVPPPSTSTNSGIGRQRANSFNRSSPPSPALLYLEESSSGDCPRESSLSISTGAGTSGISISPPPSPPLIDRILPAVVNTSSSGNVEGGLTVVREGRQRSRSFTSERDFAPAPMQIESSYIIPITTPIILPPPPPPETEIEKEVVVKEEEEDENMVVVTPSSPTLMNRPSLIPIPMINSGWNLTGAGISESIIRKDQVAKEEQEQEEEEMKTDEIELVRSSARSQRGEVERELSEAESTQMDLGIITSHYNLPPPPVQQSQDYSTSTSKHNRRHLSPLGRPEHHEVSSYTSNYDTPPHHHLSLPPPIPITESSPSSISSIHNPFSVPSSSTQDLDYLVTIANSERSHFSPEPPSFLEDLAYSGEDEEDDEDSIEEVKALESEFERIDRARRMEREQSVSPPPSIRSSLLNDSDESEEDRNTTTFGSLGYMDVDAPSALGFDTNESNSTFTTTSNSSSTEISPYLIDSTTSSELSSSSSEAEDPIAIDEESLSALERIFICAKSENSEQRARVAHHLADWLLAVDICEAVEYVLPLLAGLATDSDEIVKEVFSPQIDKIMWHFFSQCPLLELDANHDPNAIIDPSPAGSPVPSRYTHFVEGLPRSPATSIHREDSIFTPTPTSTQKTSPSNTEVSEAPKISVTNFTSLLGALLTDQSTLVAKATQLSLVRFLCRLKGKPLPPISATSSPQSFTIDLEEDDSSIPPLTSMNLESNSRTPYQLTADARRVLEDEVVTGIVLGLARLDDEEKEGEKNPFNFDHESSSSKADETSLRSGSEDEASASLLVLSPEEEQIEDGWLVDTPSSLAPMQPATTVESWGEPMVSFFDDSLDHHKSDSYLSGSPNQPMYSTFSPDGAQGDEESAIGKMVSMSLIAAIAAADCLEPEVLVQHILPEVDRMKAEPMFYVRKEAMTALGSLARTLPIEVFESTVLPLHAAFAVDSLWHVRRAACLSLPAICARLPPDLLRSQVISNIQTFSSDSSRNVRSGALEVCGELIYLFHGKAEDGGVPEELLNFFLGKSILVPGEVVEEAGFAPLGNALDMGSDPFFDSTPTWTPAPTVPTARDPDRPVMCAFNFPAVALTLGMDNWRLIQPYYSLLCQDKADKVRQSLASSMHEIAKIIGPAQSDKFLLEPFSWYLRDFAHIQSAILENLSTLIRGFGLETSKQALGMVGDVWPAISNWRRRQAVAKDLANLGAHFVVAGAAEDVLSVLAKAFKDPVAAVREEAVYALPAIFEATQNNPSARSKLWAFLFVFSEDSGYRNRMTYTTCALAAVRKGVTREIFETYFVDALSRLAQDSVINVRIGVSKAIAEACKAPLLYEHPESRARIQEILYHLAHSSDRDVKNPILEYYFSSSPSPPPLSSSPPPSGLDRSGARSRLDMNEDEVSVAEDSIPRTKSLISRFGIDDDEGMNEVALDEEEDLETAEMETSDSSSDEGETLPNHSRETSGEGEDIEMDTSPVFWTRELEEEFVEVSRR